MFGKGTLCYAIMSGPSGQARAKEKERLQETAKVAVLSSIHRPSRSYEERAAKANLKAPARTFQCPKWIKTVEVPSDGLEEDLQHLGGVCTVAFVEEKEPVKVASRFAILADEDENLEFEAPPGLEMRKTAAPLAQKWSVCSVTQKTNKVKLESTIDSGVEESAWPFLCSRRFRR